jgi:ribosome-binding factor A
MLQGITFITILLKGMAIYLHPYNLYLCQMDTTRQNKVSKLIQKEMGELFQRESRNLFSGAFITVTGVKISPDLSVAKIYLSFLAVPDSGVLVKTIREHTREIRKRFGEKIKHQLRIVPNLEFFHDDSLEYVDKIEKLFKGIVIPPAEKEVDGASDEEEE